MTATKNRVFWACYLSLLLVMTLSVDHALGDDETTTTTTTSSTTSVTLRKRAPTCDVTCPREDDPESFTECCVLDNGTVKCCSGTVAFRVDDSLVKFVGITVISTCVFLAILFLICCFWSRCPLYNTCRVDYGQTDEVPYGAKEDHALTSGDMPLTIANGQRGYAVSIKPVEEV